LTALIFEKKNKAMER